MNAFCCQTPKGLLNTPHSAKTNRLNLTNFCTNLLDQVPTKVSPQKPNPHRLSWPAIVSAYLPGRAMYGKIQPVKRCWLMLLAHLFLLPGIISGKPSQISTSPMYCHLHLLQNVFDTLTVPFCQKAGLFPQIQSSSLTGSTG